MMPLSLLDSCPIGAVVGMPVLANIEIRRDWLDGQAHDRAIAPDIPVTAVARSRRSTGQGTGPSVT